MPTLDEYVLNDLSKKAARTAAQLARLKEALLIAQDGISDYVWRISIHSAWESEGEQSLSPTDYHCDSLRQAIRMAATDFCIGAGRWYPGRTYTIGVGAGDVRTARRWDVQGRWYVSIVVGEESVSLPEDTWQGYVNELREDTSEDWATQKEEDVEPGPVVP